MSKENFSQQYMDMIRSVIESGNETSIIVSGNSMAPFLKDRRDYILLGPVNRRLKVGDMAFFQRITGMHVMHRICRIDAEGYYFVGDAQRNVEGPIQEKQIWALVSKVKRNGCWIDSKHLTWRFYSDIWVRIVAFRGLIYKIYSKFLKDKKRIEKLYKRNISHQYKQILDESSGVFYYIRKYLKS